MCRSTLVPLQQLHHWICYLPGFWDDHHLEKLRFQRLVLPVALEVPILDQALHHVLLHHFAVDADLLVVSPEFGLFRLSQCVCWGRSEGACRFARWRRQHV